MYLMITLSYNSNTAYTCMCREHGDGASQVQDILWAERSSAPTDHHCKNSCTIPELYCKNSCTIPELYCKNLGIIPELYRKNLGTAPGRHRKNL